MANQPASYEPIPPEDAAFIAAASERIRLRLKRSSEDIIEIGKDLAEVKKRLNHGQFGFWLENEFEMTDRTARNFIRVAKRFGDKSEIISDFKPTILCELAAPSTPDAVVEKAVEAAKSGGGVTVADVKQWKDEIKNLKKQHREKQASLKTQVATLQLDLKNRTDRNAELTRELQEYREERTKVDQEVSLEDLEEWKRRAMAAEEKERAILEELKEARQERTNLQATVHELESREPLVVQVEKEVPAPSHPLLPKATLFTLLDEMETGLQPGQGTVIDTDELNAVREDFDDDTLYRLLRVVAVIEGAMTAMDLPLSQWGK